jgi:pimeloyl-ACP methyl ester carboxylesterase
LLALALPVLVLLARLFLPISTPPLRDARGAVAQGSVALAERWPLNGVKQSVIVRGRNAADPALIWVSDFWCEVPALRHFNADLEDRFLVVYWCPRYSGQSLDPLASPPKNVRLQQYADDLGVLVDDVRARFHEDKVILVAHSGGTNYGLIYVAQHPEHVAAYVGVGQLTDAAKNLDAQRRFDVSEAARRHDAAALTELRAIGPSPFSAAEKATLRKWAIIFGGAFHNGLSYPKLAMESAGVPEANWRDIYAFLFGGEISPSLTADQEAIAFDTRYLRFAVPIYFMEGRYDHRADSQLAQTYLAQLQAPAKGLVWFEHSAHSPPFEEPAAFDAWIVSHLGK